MKRFECTVVTTENIIVEFDETVCNEMWLKKFSWDGNKELELNQHAKIIAQSRSTSGVSYIEGYGVPLSNGRKPWFVEQKDINEAINVKCENEDTNIYVYVQEVKETD